jgi:hypothetical protein
MPEIELTDHDALFSKLVMEIEHEKATRIKYQDIVYAVCNLVDKARDDHRAARCTIADVVERLRGLIEDAPECPVCVSVRMELGGHPDSKLDGEEGLAAATMREMCRLTIEDAEWEKIFDLYHDAIQRGTKLWQEATGRVEVLPDTAELVAWLLDLVHRAEEGG